MRAISGGGDGFMRGYSGTGEDLKALAEQSIKEQELRQDVELLKNIKLTCLLKKNIRCFFNTILLSLMR